MRWAASSELAWRGTAAATSRPIRSERCSTSTARDNDGTSSILPSQRSRPGSGGFNSNYDRDTVSYDGGDNNPQERGRTSVDRLRLDCAFDARHDADLDHAYENTGESSLGDIDGGHGAGFPALNANVGPCPPGSHAGSWIHCIPFRRRRRTASTTSTSSRRSSASPSQAGDRTSSGRRAFTTSIQVFRTTTTFVQFLTPDRTTCLRQPRLRERAWAVFGHLSLRRVESADASQAVLRYTRRRQGLDWRHGSSLPVAPSSRERLGRPGELVTSMRCYRVSNAFNIYGRYARGFRAPTIRGRDVALFGPPSDRGLGDDRLDRGRLQSDLASNRVRD